VGAFDGLRALDFLSRESNKIDRVQTNNFRGLDHLRSLSLSKASAFNNVNSGTPDYKLSVEPGAFRGLGTLDCLSMENTKMGSVTDGMFQDLVSVRQFVLDGNELLSLPTGAFRGEREPHQGLCLMGVS